MASKELDEHVLFECALCGFQRQISLDHQKQVLTSGSFEALLCGSIFDKFAFCLGVTQVC